MFKCLKDARNTSAEEGAQVSEVWQNRVFTAASQFHWVDLSMFSKLSEPQFANPKLRIIIIPWTFPLGRTKWTQSSSRPSAPPQFWPKVHPGRRANVNRPSAPLTTSKWKANLLGQWPALTWLPPASPFIHRSIKEVHGKRKMSQCYFFFLESNM